MTQYTSPHLIPYIGSTTQEYAQQADYPDISEDVANAVQAALNSLVQQITNATALAVPMATVLMWAGSINQIPTGYLLCNGQPCGQTYQLLAQKLGSPNVPDLTSRFIAGAGTSAVTGVSTYNIGNTGQPGATLNGFRTLSTNEMPSHRHGTYVSNEWAYHKHGVWTGGHSDDHSHGIGIGSADHAHTAYQSNWLINIDAAGSGYDVLTYSADVIGGGAHTHSAWSGGASVNHSHAADMDYATAGHAHTVTAEGSGAAFDVRPPYYALAYIIKAT